MIDYHERRSPNPTFDVMQKIAGALEISVTELLGEDAVGVRKPAPTDLWVRCVRSSIASPSSHAVSRSNIVNWVSAYVSQYEQSRQ